MTLEAVKLLAQIQEVQRRRRAIAGAGADIVAFVPEILHDAEAAPFLRVTFTMRDGYKFTLDTDELAPLFAEAARRQIVH